MIATVRTKIVLAAKGERAAGVEKITAEVAAEERNNRPDKGAEIRRGAVPKTHRAAIAVEINRLPQPIAMQKINTRQQSR